MKLTALAVALLAFAGITQAADMPKTAAGF